MNYQVIFDVHSREGWQYHRSTSLRCDSEARAIVWAEREKAALERRIGKLARYRIEKW